MELQKYSTTFLVLTECSLASGLLLLLVLWFKMSVSVQHFSDEVLFISFPSIFFFKLYISCRICVFFFFRSLFYFYSIFIQHAVPSSALFHLIRWRLKWQFTPISVRIIRIGADCATIKRIFLSNFLCSTVAHIIKSDAATNVKSSEEITLWWFHHFKFVFSYQCILLFVFAKCRVGVAGLPFLRNSIQCNHKTCKICWLLVVRLRKRKIVSTLWAIFGLKEIFIII